MSVNLLAGIITAAIFLPVLGLLVWFLFLKMVAGLMIRIIFLLLILGLLFFSFREGYDLVHQTLSNQFPQMKGVTCFILNEDNCRLRSDCQQAPNDSQTFHCVPKGSSQDNDILNKVKEYVP